MALDSDTSPRRGDPHKLMSQPTEETIRRMNDLQKRSIVLEDSDHENSSEVHPKDLKELLKEQNIAKTDDY